MITKFEEFLKEGLLSKMKPKTDEEFLNSLKELTDPEQIFKYSVEEDFKPGIDLANERGYDINGLVPTSIRYLIMSSNNKFYICKAIIDMKKDKLTNIDIDLILRLSTQKEKICNQLLDTKLSILDDFTTEFLTYTSNPNKMVLKLGQDKINDLSNNDIVFILLNTKKNEEMYDILGEQGFNKLNDGNIHNILDEYNSRQKRDKFIKKLIEFKNKNLTERNIRNILYYSSNKEEVEKELEKLNIK